MFNLHTGRVYCYFNRHYLILKFTECQCVLEGGFDCSDDRVEPCYFFPQSLLSPALVVCSRHSDLCTLLEAFMRSNPDFLRAQRFLMETFLCSLFIFTLSRWKKETKRKKNQKKRKRRKWTKKKENEIDQNRWINRERRSRRSFVDFHAASFATKGMK